MKLINHANTMETMEINKEMYGHNVKIIFFNISKMPLDYWHDIPDNVYSRIVDDLSDNKLKGAFDEIELLSSIVEQRFEGTWEIVDSVEQIKEKIRSLSIESFKHCCPFRIKNSQFSNLCGKSKSTSLYRGLSVCDSHCVAIDKFRSVLDKNIT